MPVIFNEREVSRLTKARRIFFFLDYDGTLAPISSRPSRALLGKKTRGLVGKIAELSGVRLAFVSGRSVRDLKEKIGLKGLIYVGNHGLEIRGDDFLWIHPKARKLKPLLKRIALELRRKLPRFPGMILENKSFGISLHYRLVDRRRVTLLYQALRKTCKPWTASNKVRLAAGKKVWELRPSIAWDKGSAMDWLLGKYRGEGSSLPVFMGDDRTDEDAFRFLKKRGMTICVGNKKQTHAQFKLKSPVQVYQVLRLFYLKKKNAL